MLEISLTRILTKHAHKIVTKRKKKKLRNFNEINSQKCFRKLIVKVTTEKKKIQIIY